METNESFIVTLYNKMYVSVDEIVKTRWQDEPGEDSKNELKI
jgi:hypothetical protein